MASRCRALSRPAINLLKSNFSHSSISNASSPVSTSSLFHSLKRSSSPTSLSRQLSQLGTLQSMLPLYSAISSARLTSNLGLDSNGSRSLSQGMLCCANPGV